VRVEEDGESERHRVMRWIELSPWTTSLSAKAGKIPSGLFVTRELGKMTKEEKQMTAVVKLAGASSHQEVNWSAASWRFANHEVHRLQVRIVKAVQENRWG